MFIQRDKKKNITSNQQLTSEKSDLQVNVKPFTCRVTKIC